jgi:outer membrane protein insertion porin family
VRAAVEPAEPPPVVRVDVEGHRSVSTRDISAVLIPRSRDPFDETVLAARADSLLVLLARHGHPFASVEVEWRDAEGGVALTVRVDEGPDARLSGIRLVGVESLDAGAVLRRFELSRGDPITRRALERDLDGLLSLYGNSGRPFAEVRVSGVSLADDGGLDVRIDVDEGLETRFETFRVVGNDGTRDYVVERESGIRPGSAYSERRLDRVRPRLERLGFFDRVSDPIVHVDPGTGAAVVGVEVSERPASRVSGVLGYVPPADALAGEFTGLLDVELGNIAGTGRSATARWEKITSGRTRIAFSYREPWLLGAPIDIGLSGEQTVNDTVYTITEGDLLVTARAGDRTRVTWAIGVERYVPGTPDDPTTTGYRTSLSGEHDGTDVPGNPTSGVILRGTLEYRAKKEAEGEERHRSGTVTAESEAFLAVRRQQVLAVRARASAVASTEDDVPFHEQLVLGGARDLRGYREEQFRGTRTGLASLEYRFLLRRRSRALAFVDLGYYYRGGSNSAKDTKLGYGIGLRAETRLGIISLDYGLGEGDRLLDGKLHVGLVREF